MPDDPAFGAMNGELPEPRDARMALDFATAALVAGETHLARHIYLYAEVAAGDRGHASSLRKAAEKLLQHFPSRIAELEIVLQVTFLG